MLGGAGLGALVYLVVFKGKIAVRGDIPVCIGIGYYFFIFTVMLILECV